MALASRVNTWTNLLILPVLLAVFSPVLWADTISLSDLPQCKTGPGVCKNTPDYTFDHGQRQTVIRERPLTIQAHLFEPVLSLSARVYQLRMAGPYIYNGYGDGAPLVPDPTVFSPTFRPFQLVIYKTGEIKEVPVTEKYASRLWDEFGPPSLLAWAVSPSLKYFLAVSYYIDSGTGRDRFYPPATFGIPPSDFKLYKLNVSIFDFGTGKQVKQLTVPFKFRVKDDSTHVGNLVPVAGQITFTDDATLSIAYDYVYLKTGTTSEEKEHLLVHSSMNWTTGEQTSVLDASGTALAASGEVPTDLAGNPCAGEPACIAFFANTERAGARLNSFIFQSSCFARNQVDNGNIDLESLLDLVGPKPAKRLWPQSDELAYYDSRKDRGQPGFMMRRSLGFSTPSTHDCYGRWHNHFEVLRNFHDVKSDSYGWAEIAGTLSDPAGKIELLDQYPILREDILSDYVVTLDYSGHLDPVDLDTNGYIRFWRKTDKQRTYDLSKWIYEENVTQKSQDECVSAVDPDLFTVVKRMCAVGESSWVAIKPLWDGFNDSSSRDLKSSEYLLINDETKVSRPERIVKTLEKISAQDKFDRFNRREHVQYVYPGVQYNGLKFDLVYDSWFHYFTAANGKEDSRRENDTASVYLLFPDGTRQQMTETK